MTEQETRRIAIVDDDHIVAETFKSMLSKKTLRILREGLPGEQYKVRTYCTEKEIREIAEGDLNRIPRADLWLIDLGLDAFDGRDIARRVRAASPSDTAIVVLTGKDESGAAAACKGIAADAYGCKPIGIDQLLQLVSSSREKILSGALNFVRVLPPATSSI